MNGESAARKSWAVTGFSWLFAHYSWHKASRRTMAVYVAGPVALFLCFLLLAIVCFADYFSGPFIPRPISDRVFLSALAVMIAVYAGVEWFVQSRIDEIADQVVADPPPAWFRRWSLLWIIGALLLTFALFLVAASLTGSRYA